ncbi:hypothetical protein C8Q76DRAFT_719509 [Earliella scabrosa]|nr:hypothetical protein C8Q76DRAFT_719509 [Earliella scabrosa]
MRSVIDPVSESSRPTERIVVDTGAAGRGTVPPSARVAVRPLAREELLSSVLRRKNELCCPRLQGCKGRTNTCRRAPSPRHGPWYARSSARRPQSRLVHFRERAALY